MESQFLGQPNCCTLDASSPRKYDESSLLQLAPTGSTNSAWILNIFLIISKNAIRREPSTCAQIFTFQSEFVLSAFPFSGLAMRSPNLTTAQWGRPGTRTA